MFSCKVVSDAGLDPCRGAGAGGSICSCHQTATRGGSEPVPSPAFSAGNTLFFDVFNLFYIHKTL